jgi:hypothetical protein
MINHDKLLYKADALQELLRTHAVVRLHIDTRKPGVILPTPLLNRPQVALTLDESVLDLDIDTEAWSCNLGFKRPIAGPPGATEAFEFFCMIPWYATYAIIADSGVGSTWTQDMPPEAIIPRETAVTKATSPPSGVTNDTPGRVPTVKTRLRGALPAGWRVIEGGKGASAPQKPPQSRERGPHSG